MKRRASPTPVTRCGNTGPRAPGTIRLDSGWRLASSLEVRQTGQAISTPGFEAAGWHRVRVPTTVVAALVEEGVYRDPYFDLELRALPGTGHAVGENFVHLPMPDHSPFASPWWYRVEFRAPESWARGATTLRFDGISYRANVWLNGRRIGHQHELAGTFRIHELDVTGALGAGELNALAVQVFAQEPEDLGINWVDWNPMPPDKNLGLWRAVTLVHTGPVRALHPWVKTDPELPRCDRARIVVSVDLHNRDAVETTAVVTVRVGETRLERTVVVGPGQTVPVRFDPDAHPELLWLGPRLWWPATMGEPHLYPVTLAVRVDGRLSDRWRSRFGVRSISSELTDQGHRLFRVNGRRTLIRGGGWASDMLLRHSPSRVETEVLYARDLGLNTIRLEGKLESDEFFDCCDRHGLMVMAGWCCSDRWEQWDRWTEADHRIAMASQEDQLLRLRGHPCMLAWLYGSDSPPPAAVEREYLEVSRRTGWPNPLLSSATAKPTELAEPTGLKMTGPYDFVVPSYWYLDTTRGGAFGFNTETGPGASIPPVESLRLMFTREHLWPPGPAWHLHAAGTAFRDSELFDEALARRYGPPRDLDDYVAKAQLQAYEGRRAMFEAYGRNRYVATGVIHWMLNNGWPSLFWHLYDHFLRPAGAYFGARKANEPVHLQFSYDDRSIVAVNGTLRPITGLVATCRLFDLSARCRFERSERVDLPPDGTVRLFEVPEPADLTATYFVRLDLESERRVPVSTNFYWLSTSPEVPDWERADWKTTATGSFADFTALSTLPAAVVDATVGVRRHRSGCVIRVELSNPGRSLAFFLRLRVLDPRGEEVLPVFWQDNLVSLLPGERRTLSARCRLAPGPKRPVVEIGGWNVPILVV
ncbi:MAG: glycosyl hydrolase family 2 [Candidatus Riflebacteria bacterium]|nr:glycosyl hydrolase family 2 [Candidatus Riflebacteria bacterium]